jgi:enoyl-[acyl-carrier-protein] reductase (NADH)
MNMACFLVPLTEAVVTTVAEKVVEKKEKKAIKLQDNNQVTQKEEKGFSFSKQLKVLNTMLWGGSALLAFEHVWHGEVVPWFPFLTAAKSTEESAVMLHEMATIGVTMAVAVTVVWGIGVFLYHFFRRRQRQKAEEKA